MGRKPTEELTKGKLHRCFYDLTHTDVMERASVNAICIVVDRLLAEYYDEYHRTVFKHTAKWKDKYEDIMANYKIYEEEYVQRAYANWLDIMLLEARNRNLDSYLLMLEWARPKKERFYEPRRVCLRKHGVIQGMQDLLDDKLDILSISLPPGTGKAQPLYSKVLTPDGFKCMGELKVGDKVIAGSGHESTIVGVYPQGKRDIYEVTFDDGSKCRCSDNHLWTVQTRDDRRRNKCRTIELSKMLGHLTCEHGKRLNYSIEYVPKIDLPERKLALHPYVMGALLGDGCFHGTPKISINDVEVMVNLCLNLPEGYGIKHICAYDYQVCGHDGRNAKAGSQVTKALKKYGLHMLRSWEKFIPKDYLKASYEQRLWLLRGLLDTDGWTENSGIGYSTASFQLSEDVMELVHSLGGYASRRVKKAGYKKNGEYIQCRDAYCLFIQFPSSMEPVFTVKRKAKKYSPKRSVIKRFIKNIQYVGKEECQCIYIDDPTHLYITDNYILTHNTSTEMFFLTGVMGWFPNDFNLFYSHSGDIVKMFYRGCLDIITNDTEYQWNKIFPKLKVERTDAGLEQINVGKFKTFPSLQTTSVGSKNAGKVRASKFLCVDDMISGIDEALNKNTLDKLWNNYSVDARQRKLDGAKEIHIATRWSVHDVIGRLQRTYEGNPRARFIAVPDIDPETGQSNFDYDNGLGFSVEFFNDQALTMDDISYRCLYKQEPIEREGLLYHEDDLRRFDSLPLREPDAIWGICDTKTTGTDFMFMPILYQYDNDYYCWDCICDNSANIGVLQERLALCLVENKVQQCEFESNAGGAAVAFEVKKKVDKMGGHCNITTKPTETNKETRIIVESDWIKQHVLFKQNFILKSDYSAMMGQLLSYSIAGKNVHDDVPDGFSNFSRMIRSKLRRHETEIIRGGLFA